MRQDVLISNDTSSLVRDPLLRKQILDYPISERDETRRAYIKFGPYQPKAPQNQPFEADKNGRRFLCSWYKLFPDWLEYSPTKNCAFCLSCFFLVSQSNALDLVLSQLRDFLHGRKSMKERIVLYYLIWVRILTHHIELLCVVVMI